MFIYEQVEEGSRETLNGYGRAAIGSEARLEVAQQCLRGCLGIRRLVLL